MAKNIKGEKAQLLKADGTPKKSLGGRPRKRVVNTIDRSKRVPLTGTRDILSVYGKDPYYGYYFFLDSSESGQDIFMAKRAGWDFVQSNEVEVGETSVFKSENVGTIIRVPSRDGRFLFLMKKPQHEIDEDKADEMYHKVDSYEQQILDPQSGAHNIDGAYGNVKIGYKERDFH